MVHEQEMADARVRCFRPLTGMVLIPFYVDEVLPGFSPPYGDGTKSDCNDKQIYKFSPPYGDGTISDKTVQIPEWFSPPYGDGTLNISQNIVKWKN